MRAQIFLLLAVLLLAAAAVSNAQETVFGYSVSDANGNMVSMEKYSSKKVIIVVNVASFCGYTYTNYRGLMDLYERYKDHGLEILAFPSNQFGEQEPKSNTEIQDFCSSYVPTTLCLFVCFVCVSPLSLSLSSVIHLHSPHKAHALT